MDRTNEFSKKDIEENKGISAFAYFGLLFIVPWFSASDSPYARFHAHQGFILMIDELFLSVCLIASYTLASVESLRVVCYFLTTFFIIVLFGGMFFFIFYGVINTLKGKAKELPLIGRMKLFK